MRKSEQLQQKLIFFVIIKQGKQVQKIETLSAENIIHFGILHCEQGIK